MSGFLTGQVAWMEAGDKFMVTGSVEHPTKCFWFLNSPGHKLPCITFFKKTLKRGSAITALHMLPHTQAQRRLARQPPLYAQPREKQQKQANPYDTNQAPQVQLLPTQ